MALLVTSLSFGHDVVVRPADATLRITLLLLLLVPFEEIGWRGFALPRLQHRYTPLASSVILAFIRALWHLPLAWASVGHQQTDRPWAYMARFTLTIIPISCLATWLFNRTGESVPIVSLFHVAVNLADYLVILPGRIGESVLWATAACNAVIVFFVWRRDS